MILWSRINAVTSAIALKRERVRLDGYYAELCLPSLGTSSRRSTVLNQSRRCGNCAAGALHRETVWGPPDRSVGPDGGCAFHALKDCLLSHLLALLLNSDWIPIHSTAAGIASKTLGPQ